MRLPSFFLHFFIRHFARGKGERERVFSLENFRGGNAECQEIAHDSHDSTGNSVTPLSKVRVHVQVGSFQTASAISSVLLLFCAVPTSLLDSF